MHKTGTFLPLAPVSNEGKKDVSSSPPLQGGRKPSGRYRALPASLARIQRQAVATFAGRRIHFMGAGGIGVSALMELCAARGAKVSGCDCAPGEQLSALRAKGFKVYEQHSVTHIADCDELVCSAAVPVSHPEVVQARREGKAINARMNMLGRIARGTRAICVTGAHGKTTTTWLIAHLLIAARRDPSVLLGGVVKEMQGNVRIGRGAEFVAEVDESDNRLHEVVPTIPVLTNIDNDHLEHYGSVEAIEQAVAKFMGSLNAADPVSVLIGCGDDPRVRRVLAAAKAHTRRPVITYGFKHNCQVRAVHLREVGLGWRFDALTPLGPWPDLMLPMPGEHNVLNALAAISVGLQLGVDYECVKEALATVERVGRRFEIKGIKSGVRVIDDYGHHPTEIEATLCAARASTEKRLGVLFQPHRFTRTRDLLSQFARCFNAADAVFVLPIYAASEAPIEGVNHHLLAAAVRHKGKPMVWVANSLAEAITQALKWAEPGDTLVTQGAGDITRAGDELVSRL